VVTIVDEPATGSLLGADEYLVKPVEKEALLAALWRCLKAKQGRPLAGPILVVEDDEATRDSIVELLRAEGHSVESKGNGIDARESVQASMPAAVVLDLLLPRVSGFELLAEWRADSRTENLPVIVLTGKDLSQEEEAYLRAHTQSVVLKQLPWQRLLVRQLDQLLGSPEEARA
jgi:CheY-like chemotaxis protein